LVARAIEQHFQAPLWVAVAVAVTVEAVGLASTHTALEMYQYNQTRRKTDPEAPFGVGVLMSTVYFVVGITITVLLEVFPDLVVLAPASFFFLAIVAYVTLALMSGHARRLEAIRQEKEDRKEQRKEQAETYRKGSGKSEALPEWLPEVPDSRTEFARLVAIGRIHLPEGVTGADLAEYIPAVGSDRTGRNWLKAIRNGKDG
jgi:hypothetical protein